MTVQLVESYRHLGLSEQELIAASLESAVIEITKSRRELRKVAKLLGMSDTEAEAFAGFSASTNTGDQRQ